VNFETLKEPISRKLTSERRPNSNEQTSKEPCYQDPNWVSLPVSSEAPNPL